MRAWAPISAAAVLTALPITVDRAVADDLPAAATAAAAVDIDPLAAGGLGVLLWLSIALVAVVVALVVLHHSRSRLALSQADPPFLATSTDVGPSAVSVGR